MKSPVYAVRPLNESGPGFERAGAVKLTYRESGWGLKIPKGSAICLPFVNLEDERGETLTPDRTNPAQYFLNRLPI
jgi:hypothetical protein